MVCVHTILRDVARLFKVVRLVAYAKRTWRAQKGEKPRATFQDVENSQANAQVRGAQACVTGSISVAY